MKLKQSKIGMFEFDENLKAFKTLDKRIQYKNSAFCSDPYSYWWSEQKFYMLRKYKTWVR